ncbi:hypothetical protein [Desertivirga xinjiangensis]|uniref:hypothetical protein n=1 Tax=Desertivirga xinjiangensis TaxID=539206 RepID=UPI00210890DB|nr:hypothetical protein [Pedobacter xinjiangensis]
MNAQHNRRKFLGNLSLGLGLAALGTSAMSSLIACSGSTNEKRRYEAAEQKGQKKLGIALVGLGNYAEGELAPALQETQHCYLAGIVF